MFIDRHITKYVVFAGESIAVALQKMDANKSQIIFSVTESGVLEGVLTDGDVRRWLMTQKNVDIRQEVSAVSNKQFVFALDTDPSEHILSLFSDVIRYVPVLDERHHLLGIARREVGKLQIGSFVLSQDAPAFLIAEIGINHNGDVALAKRLVGLAKEAGADCAKFQMRDMQSLYRNAGSASDVREDLGSQYTLDILNKSQLRPDEMFQVFDHCREQGIMPLCTPWDTASLQRLEEYGMQAYKVASADLTNHELLTALAGTRKPLILSTGMSTEEEIEETVSLLRRLGAAYVLLHCNSTYPAPFKDIHLRYLQRLSEIGDCLVGYSGHERGIHIPVAAVALGAKVIEKHFTIDKSMEGNDHKVSLLPEEFAQMVQAIRQVEQALGSTAARQLSQGEMMNREVLSKSLVINCSLEPGGVITEEMIEIKSPGKGLQPNRKAQLIGRTVKRSFKPGDFFFPNDLVSDRVQRRNYTFHRPWGLPVRYHDFRSMMTGTNPDFLEFHLSYKDMEQDIHTFLKETYDMGLVVHSPDLFAGDHILNLASTDEQHRRRSVAELQRVIDLTRSLKPFFKRAERPFIIASLGGFAQDGFISPQERDKWYGLIARSLSELDREGVEILGQTLPPFPWYFGGQLYLNLFVTPEDTAAFCERHQFRLCLDVSHSKLACNHYGLSFTDFVEQIGKHSAHLHIVDARGVDGEGVQVGEGEIDFFALAKTLEQVAPKASFIPEIWQGHKNDGEGFWVALERLEQWF
ncbi:MAG: N-acetylneuraminate synthase family protein [Candidatus Peribacteraceae bacterium]|nr:N-acetylneuraminate synthase family protein [Candidatus Peribacteraceae bacterium]MDD5741921.1 N-acetylneuraminate synthase family protein [Candidatus Peribacteraceae bacterium]